MAEENWADIGSTEDLSRAPLRHVTAGNRELAVSFKNGRFGAVSNACNHVGGPLGEGRLDGDYITCPWHNWKFHRCSGKGEPGFEEDAVPAYTVKVEGGRVLVDIASATKRTRKPHPPHPLARRSRARPAPFVLPASRPRRWTRPTRGFPVPTTCYGVRSILAPATAQKAR